MTLSVFVSVEFSGSNSTHFISGNLLPGKQATGKKVHVPPTIPPYQQVFKIQKRGQGPRGQWTSWEEGPGRPRDGGPHSPPPPPTLPLGSKPQLCPHPPCSGLESLLLECLSLPQFTSPKHQKLQIRALGWGSGDSGVASGEGCSLLPEAALLPCCWGSCCVQTPGWVLVCVCCTSECQGFGNKAIAAIEAQRGRPPAPGHTAHLQQS